MNCIDNDGDGGIVVLNDGVATMTMVMLVNVITMKR